MKKAIFYVTFTLFVAGTCFAQDSTKGTSRQHSTMSANKSMHHGNSMSLDSNRRTTNTNKKMNGNSSSSQMKTSKKSMSSSKMSVDSTR